MHAEGKTPRWTVEVLTPGSMTRVRLGIEWGDGSFAKPVEIDVPSELVGNTAAVVAYFFENCGGRYKLRKALDLPDTITFE